MATITDIIDYVALGVKIGYDRCLADHGKLNPYVSLSYAQKKYGRKTINRWINEGLLEVIKDGENNCRCRLGRERLEMVAATSNSDIWYENQEKNLKK